MKFALLLAAALNAAEVPAALDDVTDWTLEQPNKSGVPAAATEEGTFSQSETVRFGEKMRQNVLEQICRAVALDVGQGYGIDGVGSVQGKIKRKIEVMPDEPGRPERRLALLEEVGLSLNLGRALLSLVEGPAAFSLSLNVGIQGASTVVRPLPTNQSCKELVTVVKLWKQKTVLPLSSERIAAMQIGELWNIPAGISIGHAEGVNIPIEDFAGVTVSFGTGQDGAALVTLYRVSEEKLRLRLRINHVRVHNKGGRVVAVLPAVHVLQPGGGFLLAALLKAVDHAVAREISKLITASIGAYAHQSSGEQLLMEFTLDPRDPREMDLLSKVLLGDIKTLAKMAFRTITLQGTSERARRDFEELAARHERDFSRAAVYAGVNLYHTEQKRLEFALPIIFDHSKAATRGDDQIVHLTEEGGQLRLYRAEKTSDLGRWHIPLKGNLVKRNKLRSAQSFVFESKDGVVTTPQAVYIQQDGFLRKDAEDVREIGDEINRTMSFVGARGGARNSRMTVPLDVMLPRDKDGTYRQGSIRWTLVLTETAVTKILSAADDLIVKSFMNTLNAAEMKLMAWALNKTAWLGGPSGMLPDWKEFIKDFGWNDDRRSDWFRLKELCETATKIVMDVAAARRAPTQAAKAAQMADLIGGRGESGLEYQEILRVLVQLVDPLDVTSNLALNITKKQDGDPDAHAVFSLKKDRPENPLLRDAGRAKMRYDPVSSVFTDML
jgi:hypothetical protein